MAQELYELPEGWEWKELLDIASTSGFKVGKIPKKDFLDKGSLPIIDQSQSYIAGYCESEDGFEGKLPVIVYGDHTNSVKHVDFQFICGADGTKVLVPNTKVFSWFLYFSILRFRPDSQGYRRHFPILKQQRIPLPPLNEQKRIVAKLDALFTRIDTAITHLQQTLELSKALFSSALDEAFNGGDNAERVTIKEIAKKIQYGHTAKARDIGNAQFLRITDIQKGAVDWSHVPYVLITEDDLKKYSLNIHDIVFARSGATSGKSFLITSAPNNAIFASYLIRVVPNIEMVIPQFVYLYFQSPEYWEQVSSNVSGAAQPNINGTKLGGFKIPLPPIDEQRKIVAHLETLSERTHTLEASTQEKLNDLTTLKASLLDAAFKGQL